MKIKDILAVLEESTGFTYKKHQQKDWENDAKTSGYKVRSTVDKDGESGKSWKAEDKEGNHRGEFHLDHGGSIKQH